MDKFRKIIAKFSGAILVNLFLSLKGIYLNSWIWWILSTPIIIGWDWIVEKLDKIE